MTCDKTILGRIEIVQRKSKAFGSLDLHGIPKSLEVQRVIWHGKRQVLHQVDMANRVVGSGVLGWLQDEVPKAILYCLGLAPHGVQNRPICFGLRFRRVANPPINSAARMYEGRIWPVRNTNHDNRSSGFESDGVHRAVNDTVIEVEWRRDVSGHAFSNSDEDRADIGTRDAGKGFSL